MMSLLKRLRDEASAAEEDDEPEQGQNYSTPMEIAEPDEPVRLPRRSRKRFSLNELERLRKKCAKLHATLERLQMERKNGWENQCFNCVKRFDDAVRKVHADLLAGRITMVGVTLTHKLPITTCNRRVQTSPERVLPVPKCTHTIQERVQLIPKKVQPIPERVQVIPKKVQPIPERVQHILKRLHPSTEQVQQIPKRVQPIPEKIQHIPKKMKSAPERLHYIPKTMRHIPKKVEWIPVRAQHVSEIVPTSMRLQSSLEREASLTRDFCGGTDPSILKGGCQCDRCLVEHNAGANARSARTRSRHHFSRIHRNRAHSPCKDDALFDLHQHVLAGDKKTPGSMYVGILASLHEQGPCEVPCKLRADVDWMNDHIPKQAETQTDLTGDDGVRDQATQTNLARSVGIQKGKALTQIIAARSSRYKTMSTQLDLPEMPQIHRPVGRVMPTVIRNRN